LFQQQPALAQERLITASISTNTLTRLRAGNRDFHADRTKQRDANPRKRGKEDPLNRVIGSIAQQPEHARERLCPVLAQPDTEHRQKAITCARAGKTVVVGIASRYNNPRKRGKYDPSDASFSTDNINPSKLRKQKT
jgi:hypothetical protein